MSMKRKLKKIQSKTLAKVFAVFTFGLGAWLIIVPTREWIAETVGNGLVGVSMGVALLILGSVIFVYLGMKGD